LPLKSPWLPPELPLVNLTPQAGIRLRRR
jgi:hypothetical protein